MTVTARLMSGARSAITSEYRKPSLTRTIAKASVGVSRLASKAPRPRSRSMRFSSAVAIPTWTKLWVPVRIRSAVSGSDSSSIRTGRSAPMARSTPPITALIRSVPVRSALARIWSASRRRARHHSTWSSSCSRLPTRRYKVARATPIRPASERISSRCPATKASVAAAKIGPGTMAGGPVPSGSTARISSSVIQLRASRPPR